MSQYKVLKPFQGEREFKTGDVVDLDGRNVAKLVDQRYLALLDDEAPAPKRAAPATESTPKRRGRPKGSKNKPKAVAPEASPPA